MDHAIVHEILGAKRSLPSRLLPQDNIEASDVVIEQPAAMEPVPLVATDAEAPVLNDGEVEPVIEVEQGELTAFSALSSLILSFFLSARSFID